MRALSSTLRKQLELSVLAARRAAEGASRAAVEGLGVFDDRRPEHLDASQAALRVALRAKWRQLGDDRELLIAECAYEQWHRLLFARFLAENSLLLHPEYKAPVTLLDCDELAAELGEPDAWSVAARFAAEILPGIFRLGDPCVQLRLAPEGRQSLEQILDVLPAETFLADDALGWVYQFWQKDKKDEINSSERKIGGADLGPVTQLFTESYMVRFLLENSLGAWWAARHPDSSLVKDFDYLRFDDDGNPAAGAFDGWPERVAEITVMDPCCGSGHFLVEAFSMLWQMRREEEGLEPLDAQDAVLRDNLFGLEIDPRCVQIAMFAVALQAWKSGGGWRQLPVPHVACSGIPVKAPVEEWTALAGEDERLQSALRRRHLLFSNADTLGSLIDPREVAESGGHGSGSLMLDAVAWEQVAPLFEAAAFREKDDIAVAALGAQAAAVARAASLLSREYTLVTTNPPYLTRQQHSPLLVAFADHEERDARTDLATLLMSRTTRMVVDGGTVLWVTPQAWTTLDAFQEFRRRLFTHLDVNVYARLGAGAFGSITGEIVKVALFVATWVNPQPSSSFIGIDASGVRGVAEKTAHLRDRPMIILMQSDVLDNPDGRLLLVSTAGSRRLSEYADVYKGLTTGDDNRFRRRFWELPSVPSGWCYFQTGASDALAVVDGCQDVLDRPNLLRDPPPSYAQRCGPALGNRGIAVSHVGKISACLYTGTLYSTTVAVLIPRRTEDFGPIWHFTRSPEFAESVHALDSSLKVPDGSLVKVPFDVERWRKVAENAGPPPEARSDDPTQWLFKGRAEAATDPLQVVIARLVGYRWPGRPDEEGLDPTASIDGILCLPAVAGELPAADLVQQVFAAEVGERWSPATLKDLIEQAGSKKKSLAAWLRDDFFKQHCALFGNRPFVWHIWDGLRDGFSALVNYHRLDRKTLEKLTYTYLGQDWVERQRAGSRDEVPGAEARLSAALALQGKLEAIIEGDAPYDIYVRWKERQDQPIGWEPDLSDGVRLNVRPFVEAGVLRAPFNVHWRKDRGRNADGSERKNDVHLTLKEKRDAREQVGET